MSFKALHFATLCVWVAPGSQLRGEVDDVDIALDQARLQYEAQVQAIRDEVLEKIGTRQAALRAKSKPKLEDLTDLDSAKREFTMSGRWPTFRNFNDSQTKLRKAAKSLSDAFAKAETGYLKAGRDTAAKAVRAEHEQFLKECDIGSWGENFVAHWNDEQRITGSECKTIIVDGVGSGGYRMELIAQTLEGDGSLILRIPFDARNQMDLTTLPATGEKIHILLTIRESLVSSDLGVARPLASEFRDDDTPFRLEVGCLKGKVRLESVRFKPIIPAVAHDVALAADPKPTAPIAAVDDVAPLPPRRSKWRGYGWHGQNPHDLKKTLVTDAIVTLGENGRVEIQTDGWESCTQIWVFESRGTQLSLAEIHSKCRFDEFTEVQGAGFLDDQTLQFRSSARVAGHSINAIVYSKFELRKSQNE